MFDRVLNTALETVFNLISQYLDDNLVLVLFNDYFIASYIWFTWLVGSFVIQGW